MNIREKGAFRFAREKYFKCHSDSQLVQDNYNLITSFVQDSVDALIVQKLVAQSAKFHSMDTP